MVSSRKRNGVVIVHPDDVLVAISSHVSFMQASPIVSVSDRILVIRGVIIITRPLV